ncbi:MAG: HlyD family secretion protein [Rikenellaceae bacterium]|nr:HlyD family secretion protein [Rikenellaceae bacterium]
MKIKTKKLIYNIFACILLLGAISWVCEKFIHLGNVEFTENAQVKQLIVPVNSRVQGYIKEVRFDEYQKVQKGDTLVIIEDVEYRYMVAQAEANLANAQTGKDAMHNVISTTATNLSVTDASIEEARIVFENAERNYKRFSTLYEQNAVTRQQYDDMNTTYLAAKARYDMLCRQKESVQSVSREQNTRLGQNEAGIKLAEAALELARLNLSYTVVLAPCDGYTGRKEIQQGQLIQPGQTLVDVVDSEEKWIVANYKETQTANITEGCEVEIEVDAVPDHKFKGVVRSVSRATGASFSLMPQDNSSGNFVKIEQRIPVRIDFAEDNDAEAMERVSAGMNVECKVLY